MTQLRITLNGSKQNDAQAAQFAFDERTLGILAKIFDAERAAAIYARVKASQSDALVIDGIVVSLERSAWGDSRFGGYDWNLTIQHPKYQEDI